MSRKPYKKTQELNHEFELDLAPLLAVMVKLVPVLLVSSGFISMMNIETDLPQVVKEAIQTQDKKPNHSTIQLDIHSQNGIKIIVENEGQQNTQNIPNKTDGTFNLEQLHEKLVEAKNNHPEIFRIELNPEENIKYETLVKIMDEARKSRDKNIRFPVMDLKTNKLIETDYMFPDIVFVNIIEGSA